MERIEIWSLAAIFSGVVFAAGGPTSLVEAAKVQDKDALRAFLKQKVDVNAAEPDGTTALLWAAHWNDIESVDALLKAGAYPKVVNRYGASPLSEAALSGDGAVVERLLKAGAEADMLTNPQGETVLMSASRVGNAEAVKALLENGANVNARENYRWQTAIMSAAAEGHTEVIKLLIAAGADLSVRSIDRDTTPPKMSAGTSDVPIPRGGLTALLFSARQGHVQAAQVLIEGGADIDQVDSDGNNALILAILNAHYDVAQMLIDEGADPNVANRAGRTALYSAVDMRNADLPRRPARRATNGITSMDIIKSLLAKGAKVNAQLTAAVPIAKLAQDTGDRTMSAGATSFIRAARSADIESMRLLISKGADAKLANKDGLNALMVAAGVDWGDKIKGSEAEALEAVKLCLELGLDVNAMDDKGDTALHGATFRGANSIVQLLAEKGAKLDARNKQDFTPLDIALGKVAGAGPNESTVALLRQLNSDVEKKAGR